MFIVDLGCCAYFLQVVVYSVVTTSEIDCLERLVFEVTCYVLSGMLNSAHSLINFSSLLQIR